MKSLFEYLATNADQMLADVERIVRLESPSRHGEGINRVQDVNAEWFRPIAEVRRYPADDGDLLHVLVPGASAERILLLAHVDTVYPVGSWERLWRVEGQRAFGPGSYDMKGGIVQAVWALRALRAMGLPPARCIDVLLTSDEEIGSEMARPHIETLARGAHAVLVLEPPFMNGDLKVARKGVGDYVIRVVGRAAHQGVEPENGRNAIISAAHLIRELDLLQDHARGTTLGPNVIRGGTASNVVADEAVLHVDVRVWDLDEAARVDSAIRQIQPLEGTTYQISGGLNRPPMEPSEGTLRILEAAQMIAEEIGFTVGAARVGGGSDGNFTSQLAPTLDGFGAMGAHAHQKNQEYIRIADLVPRAALLGGMLLSKT